jgi:1-deoxy-D-xylulose-5-phosphate reductoisomerase
MTKRTRIILLGATGSIGDSTLKLVRAHPDRFEIVALTAHSNEQKLLLLAQEFSPRAVGITHLATLSNGDLPANTALHTGENAAYDVLNYDADIVVAAMSGAAGVRPVMRAITCGMTIALANKEALVCAGALMMDACTQHNARLLPVDSEHNAIYQLLSGQEKRHVSHITLTASGGPFLNTPLEAFATITPQQAVAHPKWSMGAKISVDSATMMNKGLECIEAHWLFALKPEQIQVLIHPQAVAHGMVSFTDGSSFVHVSPADMTIPLSYCLYWPERHTQTQHVLSLTELNQLQFTAVDRDRYPALSLSMQALQEGSHATICLNAANEVAVAAFLSGRINFTGIVPLVADTLEQVTSSRIATIEDVMALDALVRIRAEETLHTSRRHYG